MKSCGFLLLSSDDTYNPWVEAIDIWNNSVDAIINASYAKTISNSNKRSELIKEFESNDSINSTIEDLVNCLNGSKKQKEVESIRNISIELGDSFMDLPLNIIVAGIYDAKNNPMLDLFYDYSTGEKVKRTYTEFKNLMTTLTPFYGYFYKLCYIILVQKSDFKGTFVNLNSMKIADNRKLPDFAKLFTSQFTDAVSIIYYNTLLYYTMIPFHSCLDVFVCISKLFFYKQINTYIYLFVYLHICLFIYLLLFFI